MTDSRTYTLMSDVYICLHCSSQVHQNPEWQSVPSSRAQFLIQMKNYRKIDFASRSLSVGQRYLRIHPFQTIASEPACKDDTYMVSFINLPLSTLVALQSNLWDLLRDYKEAGVCPRTSFGTSGFSESVDPSVFGDRSVRESRWILTVRTWWF